MGTISTKTVCPYPFTFPQGVTNGTVDDCSITYAAYLDPGFLVLQIILGICFGLIILPWYLYRMYALRNYAKTAKSSITSLVQFKLYLIGIIISTGVVLESIDLLGARNLITPYFYFIIDEIVAGTLFILALVIVEFYLITSQSLKSKKKGLPLWVLVNGSLITYLNFVGFQILGMTLSDYYALLESLKLYGAAVILLLYCWVSYVARSRILDIITHSGTETKADLSMKAAVAFRYPSNLSSSDRTVLTVKKKFCEWYTIVIIAIVALIVVATFVSELLNGTDNWQWALDIQDTPDIGFYIFKVLYAIAVLVVLRMFKVPTPASTSERRLDNRSDSKSNFREKETTENEFSAAL